MRTLLEFHEDVHTVPEAIGKIMEEYVAEGYQVERLSPINFKIVLKGGWVHIYWENNFIWQEIIEEKEEKNTAESAEKLADAKSTKKENEQVTYKDKQPVPMEDMEEAADNRGQQEVKQPLNGEDILDDLVVKIVPLLIGAATNALQIPKYEGLEFAVILLEEALKYGELYPRAFAMPDKSMYEAVRKLRQWKPRRDACHEETG